MLDVRRLVVGLAGSLLLSTTLWAESRADGLPFKLYRGYTIVVRGSIGKLHKQNFLIDTGAVPSVVDRRVARELGITGVRDELSVFSRSTQVERAILPAVVKVGPLRKESLPVLVEDLGSLQEWLGIRVDAMIGLDMLGQGSLVIDFQAKRMFFGRPRTDIEGSTLTVPFEPGPGYVLVSMEVQGQAMRLMVDTGSNHMVLFEPRARARLTGLRVEGTQAQANLGGTVQLSKVKLSPDAHLGPMHVGGQEALLMPTDPSSLPDFDGLLGVAWLKVKRITFDFERKSIGLGR